MVFVLWGAYAQKKSKLIDATRHRIVTAAHPSPLSAKKFLGSKPFSAINQALTELGQTPIDWQLPSTTAGATLQDAVESVTTRTRLVEEKTTEPSDIPPPTSPPQAHVAALLDTVLTYEFSLRQHTLLPPGWQAALAPQFTQPYFQKLEKFVAAERQQGTVCPAEMDVFNAFRLTPIEQVNVVLLGEEPPALVSQADGLAFSARTGAKATSAAQRIFQELQRDLGCWPPTTGHLAPWARQGVLLLDSVLTIRAGEPGSHERKGWETFTDAALRALSAQPQHIVFVLWGEKGRKKERLIDPQRHTILTGPHPLERDFADSRPFSAINNALERHGQSAVWWQLFAG